MVAENEGVALLSLAAKKGLIAQDSAVGLRRQIESGIHGPGAGAKPIAELLVKDGHITATQADLLLSELAKSHGPKVIGGHQLVAKLGQGGMGAVYKAVQLSMQRDVALKVLTPALARDKDFIERFIREARAAGKVVHPNVISCFDVGMDNGVAYMSLELVSGGDALKRTHAAGGKLQEREALEIIRDCAHGLAAIAKAGLIHRDIKPANIFLTEDGHAKLADLGLARSSSGDDRMTQTGAAVGSPAYMAPEQAKGIHDLDIRGDIYALGATLFHLLCGAPPFTGSSVFATVNKVINEPIPDPRTFNPAITAATTTIIRTAMAKDRAQRYQTPEALAEVVEAVLAGKTAPAHAPHAGHGHAPHAPHAHGPAARAHKPAPAAKRPAGAMIAICGVAAVGVLAGAALLLGGGAEPVKPTATENPVVAAAHPAPAPAPMARAAPAPAPVAPAPAPVAPSPEAARPVLAHLADLRAQRLAANEAPAVAVAAPVVAQPEPATAQAPAAGAIPEWAADGTKALDLALAGDHAGAVATAKPLPIEYRDAFAALQAARKEVPKIYVAHQAAIIAAKPKLKMTDAKHQVSALSEKGMTIAGEGIELKPSWDVLIPADHATLRAIVAKDKPTTEQQRVFARLELSASTLAAADAGDPAVAALQRLAQFKTEIAVAEQKRSEIASGQNAEWKALSERTRRTLANLHAVTTFEPTVIQGMIDRPIELRDFVVIRPDAHLAPGGRLIPTAGAVVLNASPKVNYEPVAVRGVAFISCSLLPNQSMVAGGFERGLAFSNCVFFGNVLIDSVHSPRYQDCAFIGGGEPGTNEVRSWNVKIQRDNQLERCDFHRLRWNCGLPIAASDKCAFTACELGQIAAPGVLHAKDTCAWDGEGFQAKLAAQGIAVRLHAQAGVPTTPFGPDVGALAKALDQMTREWIPRLRLDMGARGGEMAPRGELAPFQPGR